MRGATYSLSLMSRLIQFQPTLPMRGATLASMPILISDDISTHAPHAGSDLCVVHAYDIEVGISTHAPHAGSDQSCEHESQ